MDRPDSRISCNDRERYADGLRLSAICALGELKAASSSHRDVTPDTSLKFAFEQREFAFPFYHPGTQEFQKQTHGRPPFLALRVAGVRGPSIVW